MKVKVGYKRSWQDRVIRDRMVIRDTTGELMHVGHVTWMGRERIVYSHGGTYYNLAPADHIHVKEIIPQKEA